MRKYIVCFSILFCCVTGIYGQAISTNVSDYLGTWQGHDSKGNEYKLTLNANYTVQITMNGEASPASLFKLELENSVSTLGYGIIDFYAPSQSANQNTITLSASTEPWKMIRCGIVSLDGTNMSLQIDQGLNRPAQFDVAQTISLKK